MKITTEHVGRLLAARLERTQRAGRTPGQVTSDHGEPDRATFSTLAEEVRLALASLRGSPETEEARLGALADQVRSGNYRVPSEAVADAFLRDLRSG